ncbi:MAG: NAD(+)--rifampin ADP-ribosyltransferase, partial [Bacteroidia bacterium]
MKSEKNNIRDRSTTSGPSPFAQTYFHGTKADLNIGDYIEAGYNSNFGQRK